MGELVQPSQLVKPSLLFKFANHFSVSAVLADESETH
jgi:hypothetical protein